jgi:phage shock protein A
MTIEEGIQFTEQDYTEACDEVATLLAELHEAKVELEKAKAERDALEAKYGRLVWSINVDKDGDGFISKDAMDLLFPCEIEGD